MRLRASATTFKLRNVVSAGDGELLEVACTEIAGTTSLSIVVPAKPALEWGNRGAGTQCRCSNKPGNYNDAGFPLS